MTISNPGDLILTVKSLLKAPTQIGKRIIRPEDKFLSEYLFRGPIKVQGGAYTFSEAEESEDLPARGGIEQIEPGGDYPMVDVADGEEQAGRTSKFGAGYRVTYEARDDNNMNPIARGNLKVRNAMLLSDAGRSLAALEKKVIATPATAGGWGTAGNWEKDILTAVSTAPTGYDPDTIVISKATALKIRLLKEIKDYAPRENKALNPLFNQALEGLLDLHWIINNRAGAKAYLLQVNTAGFVAESDPFGVTVVDRPENDEFIVKAKRRSAPEVDEPGAVTIIAGV
ncbi:phage major capsid protein [Paeniglutamicibacter sp. R2-26]|uniref:phage major capsid protein n=1 Tax=Paeniglutamicibacter sp. R2-26 TaxID=3144417 RepID=UPI003EE601CD